MYERVRRKEPIVKLSSSILLAAALAAGAAMADARLENPMDLKNQGTVVTVSGTLIGLSTDAPATATVTATGTATITCANGGPNEPPGIIRPSTTMPVTLTAMKVFPPDQIESKGVRFSLTTSNPVTPDPRAAGCPGDNWKVEVVKVDFRNVALTVEQKGRLVLNESSPM